MFLKRLRVIVSLIFFLLIFFLFIDFANTFSSALINGILYLQFIPSVLKFINLLAISSAGFILILILTLLFGRVYCSSFCPLGTLQDIISFLSKKFHKKKFYKKAKAYNWLQYSILALVVVFLVFGSVVLVNLLDPYSSFGKIVSNPRYGCIPGTLQRCSRAINAASVAFIQLISIKIKTTAIPTTKDNATNGIAELNPARSPFSRPFVYPS